MMLIACHMGIELSLSLGRCIAANGVVFASPGRRAGVVLSQYNCLGDIAKTPASGAGYDSLCAYLPMATERSELGEAN